MLLIIFILKVINTNGFLHLVLKITQTSTKSERKFTVTKILIINYFRFYRHDFMSKIAHMKKICNQKH